MVGVLHDRDVRRRVQGELPAALAIGLRRLGRRFEHVLRDALHFIGIHDEVGKGIGGIEQVVAEPRGQRRELLRELHVAGALGLGQLGAAETKIPQLVLQDFFLLDSESLELRRSTQRLEFPEEPLIGRQLREVLREFREVAVVGVAQLRAVHHGVQMPDLSPGTVEALVGIVQGPHETLPRGRARVGCAVAPPVPGCRRAAHPRRASRAPA